MADLLPCPFCGNKSPKLSTQILVEPQDIAISVFCSSCGARGAISGIMLHEGAHAFDPEHVITEIQNASQYAAEDWNNRRGNNDQR